MCDVNLKNLAWLESNELNNQSATIKHVYLQNHHMDCNNSNAFEKKQIIQKEYWYKIFESFFIHSNNHAFNNETNCFYRTTYHNYKIIKVRWMSLQITNVFPFSSQHYNFVSHDVYVSFNFLKKVYWFYGIPKRLLLIIVFSFE